MLYPDTPGNRNSAHLGELCTQEIQPELLIRCVFPEIPEEFRSEPFQLHFIHTNDERGIAVALFTCNYFCLYASLFQDMLELYFQFFKRSDQVGSPLKQDVQRLEPVA